MENIKIGKNTWKEKSFDEKTHNVTIVNQKNKTEIITPLDLALIKTLSK